MSENIKKPWWSGFHEFAEFPIVIVHASTDLHHLSSSDSFKIFINYS